jgi:hypothetical protein
VNDVRQRILAGLAAGCTWGGNVFGLMEHSPDCQKWYNHHLDYFPFLEQVDVRLAHFGAAANATPMLTAPRTLRVEPQGAFGTAWADKSRWLVAVYNGGPEAAAAEAARLRVKVTFDLPTLKRYGVDLPSRFRADLYRPDCTLRETQEVAVRGNVVEVPLQVGELATLRVP